MKLKEARHQLTHARKRLRKALKEIAALMTFIAKKGGDPSGRPDLSNRNQRIYKLSTDRVRAICAKIKTPEKRYAK